MADKDNTTPEDDDLPVLTNEDQTEEDQTETGEDGDDEGDSGSDDYDIRSELDDNDRHILDQLTDEELAALAGDDEDDEDAEEDQADDEPAPQAAAEPEQPEVDDAGQDPQPEAQPAPVELTAEQIAAAEQAEKDARKAALDKWRDGDLTDDELEAEIEAARNAREDALAAAQEQALQEAEDQAFETRQAAFHEVARDYLTKDYPELADKAHLAEFDRHVRSVTASPRFAGKTPLQMLEAAHKLYLAEADALGFSAPPLKRAAKSDAKAEEPAPKPAKPAPRAKKPEVVPTLARVPAAAMNNVADGKWGGLAARFEAAATADEREAIMMSLSDQEREAFASMDI